MLCWFFEFCCFKQKTAYEMRISDWSSDVCSSDLDIAGLKVLLNQYEEDGSAAWVYTLALIAYREQDPHGSAIVQEAWDSNPHVPAMLAGLKRLTPSRDGYIKIGRASCRERVCQYV